MSLVVGPSISTASPYWRYHYKHCLMSAIAFGIRLNNANRVHYAYKISCVLNITEVISVY
jgi:hypothetical protein